MKQSVGAITGAIIFGLLATAEVASGQFRVDAVDPPVHSVVASVNPEIVVDLTEPVIPSSVTRQSLRVYGSVAGAYSGQIVLENGNRRLRFRLLTPFIEAERVTVVLSSEIRSESGAFLQPYQWSFTVRVEFGDGRFSFRTSYSLQGMKDPVAIYVADLNRDFRPDIITANNADHTLSVLVNELPLQTGQGFAAPFSIPVGQGPTSVTGGDLDRDGFQDLIVTNLLDNTVSLLLNRATGELGPDSFAETRLDVGKKPVRAAAADFNNDGWLDLAVLLFGSDELEIYENDGRMGFTRTGSVEVGLGPSGLVARDFDLDGDPDLVVGSTAGKDLSLLTNDGSGTFLVTQTIDAGVPVTAVRSADLLGRSSGQPGDGRLELVAVSPNANTLQIYRADRSPLDFALAHEFTDLARPYGVAVGNFETGDPTDLDLDVVAPSFGAGTVTLFRNRTADLLEETTPSFDAGLTPFAATAADFNGDRTLDVAVTNVIEGSVTILWNQGGEVRSAGILVCEDTGTDSCRLDFGDVYVGDQKTKPVAFVNIGVRPVTVTSVRLEGMGSVAFSTALPDTVVLPGQRMEMNVTFAPPDTGGYEALALLSVNDSFISYDLKVELVGRGVIVAIAVEPDTLDFGVVAAGFSKTDTLRVRNLGNDTLQVAPQAIGSSVFTASVQPFEVLPYGEVAFPVTFSPVAPVAYQDALQLQSNDRERPEVEVVLLGSGFRNPPRITSADTATAIEDVPFQYVGTAVDPDGTAPIITFRNYPHWLEPSGNRLAGTPREGDRDTSFVVLASDGFLFDTLYVSLTVLPVNDPPILEFIADKTVTERDLLEFAVRASDPEDSVLVIGAQSLPPGASLIPTGRNQARFSWTPDFGTAGQYVVTFVVTEQIQENPLSVSQDVRITVQKRLPDLIAAALEGDFQDVRRNQFRVVRGTVQNVNAPVDAPFVVAVLLNEEVVADTTVMSLPPEAQFAFSARVEFTRTGSHQLSFVVDQENRIAEVDESNNIVRQTVSVSQGRVVVRPNPFTPNDDGFNDRVVFDLVELVLRQPSMRIYSFEGRLLRDLGLPSGNRLVWDGRDDQGQDQLPGVYLFVLRDGGSIVESGYVVLAR